MDRKTGIEKLNMYLAGNTSAISLRKVLYCLYTDTAFHASPLKIQTMNQAREKISMEYLENLDILNHLILGDKTKGSCDPKHIDF